MAKHYIARCRASRNTDAVGAGIAGSGGLHRRRGSVGVHLVWEQLRAGTLMIVLSRRHQPGTYEMLMQHPHRALIALLAQVTVNHLLDAFANDTRLRVPLDTLAAFAA